MSPISPTSSGAAPLGSGRKADSPAEAAHQFESVLVRQFVEVMTKDLFNSEEDGMLSGQADLQRDTLTDTLTEHLVDNGTFGIADLMIRQWEQSGRVPTEPAADAAADAGPTAPGGAPPRALRMDEALRMYPPAQALSRSIDTSQDDLP